MVTFLTKIRRGNYVFVTWKGDHAPRHVHVFRDARLIATWDLEGGRVMSGWATKQIRKLIAELQREGRL